MYKMNLIITFVYLKAANQSLPVTIQEKKNILSTDVNLCMSVCISEVVYIVFLPHIHK